MKIRETSDIIRTLVIPQPITYTFGVRLIFVYCFVNLSLFILKNCTKKLTLNHSINVNETKSISNKNNCRKRQSKLNYEEIRKLYLF